MDPSLLAAWVLWRDVKQHVPVLLSLLDQYDVRNADHLRGDLRGLPAWDWYDRHDLSLNHFGSTSKEGRVDVLPRGVEASSIGSTPDSIHGSQACSPNPGGGTTLRSSNAQGTRNYARPCGYETGIPFSLLSAIIDGNPIPAGHPAGMEPLTDLWIVTSYGTNAVHGSDRDRWNVQNYATAGEHTATIKKNSEALKRIIEAAELMRNSPKVSSPGPSFVDRRVSETSPYLRDLSKEHPMANTDDFILLVDTSTESITSRLTTRGTRWKGKKFDSETDNWKRIASPPTCYLPSARTTCALGSRRA